MLKCRWLLSGSILLAFFAQTSPHRSPFADHTFKESKFSHLGWFWSDDWNCDKESHVREQLREVMNMLGHKLDAKLKQLEVSEEYGSGNVALWAYNDPEKFYSSIKQDVGRCVMSLLKDVCEAFELKSRLGKNIKSLRNNLALDVVSIIDFHQLKIVMRSVVVKAGFAWDVHAMVKRLKTDLIEVMLKNFTNDFCRYAK